ncbi:MAG: plastocyanin/azurin family copper-binding protein [Acidimicrobiia bacterium]
MLAALVLAIGLSACGSDANESSSDEAPKSNNANTVSLRLIAFQPDDITVPAGTTVTWRNEDGTDHTVTSGTVAQQGGSATAEPDGRFESGTLGAGGEFSFTFGSPGTYTYFCKLHPATMRGQVTVT